MFPLVEIRPEGCAAAQPNPVVWSGGRLLWNAASGTNAVRSNSRPTYGAGIWPAGSPDNLRLQFGGAQTATDSWFGAGLFASATVVGCVVRFCADVISNGPKVLGSWGNTGTPEVLFVQINTNGAIITAIRNSGGSTFSWTTAAGAVTPGRPTAVAVHMRTGSAARVWVDGIEWPTTRTAGASNSWTAVTASGAQGFRIGCSAGETANLTGWVDLAFATVSDLPPSFYESASNDPWGTLYGETDWFVPVSAAGVTSHATEGALVSDAAVIAGTATHLTLHTSTGALASDAASIAGTAVHSALHQTSGTLAADAASLSGTAVHRTLHQTSGALVAQAAALSGVAQNGTSPAPVVILQGNLGWRPEKFSRKRRFELEGLRQELEAALYPSAPAPTTTKEPLYAPPSATPTLRQALNRVRAAAAGEAPAATQARILREAIEEARREAETARRAHRRRRQQEFLLLT